MAHFTELDSNNIVIRTIVVNDAYILDSDGRESDSVGAAWCRNHFGQVDSAVWIQTSFNGNIRKQYAEPGFKYDAVADEFVRPQPFPSWTLDSNNDWQPPHPDPSSNTRLFHWSEQTYNDDNSTGWLEITHEEGKDWWVGDKPE